MTKSHHCFVADCANFELGDSSQQQTSVEGYLMLPAWIAKSGLQDYQASELGLQDSAKDVIRVYRPEDEVFELSSMASFETKPVTLEHPPTMVDPASFKDYAVGFSSHQVERDGEHLKTELVIMDADAIAAVEAGKVELSIGYFADYEFELGVTENGESYDAVQRNIRGNHIALVNAGRCGGTCRLGAADHTTDAVSLENDCAENSLEKEKAMTIVTVDDRSLEMTEEAAQVVQDLLERRSSLEQQLSGLSTVDVDSLVEERLTLVEIARAKLPTLDFQGLDNKQLRLAVLQGLFVDEDFDARSEDYQVARLDAVQAQPVFMPVNDKIGSALAVPEQRANARDSYLNSLTSSWKGR
jgi:uncharacterized protein